MLAVVGALAALVACASASGAVTRYSLAGGCYQVSGVGGPFRMQAAALGQYLLYGAQGDYLGPALTQVPAPSNSTVWEVGGSSKGGFTLKNVGNARTLPVTFTQASGCPVYPEAGINTTGTTFRGTSPSGQVMGTIDAHTHVTAFEFLGGDWHCGRPWSPLGVTVALPDCAPFQQGVNGQVESFEDYGVPFHNHDTRGWPTFHEWPGPTKLAEEGDYYTGMKRAWQAGLRVMVTQLVDNEVLCLLMTKRHNPCNDMAAVRIQARALHDLQDYIDAQSGGPGKGFFRIVTSPFQARQVINEGKLAVVEGIEVSHLFNCGEYLGVPECNRADVDAGLREIRALGVSTFFPIHKFDNGFGGTKMDGGDVGVLINLGNHFKTGSFWDVHTCTGAEHDSAQVSVPVAGGLAQLLNGSLSWLKLGSQLPSYPPPPSCNAKGLTSLGAYLLNQMIKQHFIVELDHMDAKTADQALSIILAHAYSGVISAHSWDSPEENAAIYKVGGFVTPIAGASPASFISQWQATQKIRNKRFYSGTGFGYGADMNGLAEESQPASANPIAYPFKSHDGRVNFGREQWGQRVFDLNQDGVANYGMFPDWLQELQQIGGRPILTDMFKGAEAYLQMWERAYGVAPTGCHPPFGRFSAAGVGRLRLGASPKSTLFALGQPSSRPGRSYRYCVTGAGNRRASVAAVFTPRGRLGLIASTARANRAAGVGTGASATLLRTRATLLGGGVWLGRRLRGGARHVYGVRGGRVRFVGVASRSEVASRRALSGDLRAAGLY
jgi:hypothetical protein